MPARHSFSWIFFRKIHSSLSVLISPRFPPPPLSIFPLWVPFCPFLQALRPASRPIYISLLPPLPTFPTLSMTFSFPQILSFAPHTQSPQMPAPLSSSPLLPSPGSSLPAPGTAPAPGTMDPTLGLLYKFSILVSCPARDWGVRWGKGYYQQHQLLFLGWEGSQGGRR